MDTIESILENGYWLVIYPLIRQQNIAPYHVQLRSNKPETYTATSDGYGDTLFEAIGKAATRMNEQILALQNDN